MTRADAFGLVRERGGKPRESVTRQTDVLVVGELGWPLLDNGRPSQSLSRAKSYSVRVASEREFLEWLGKSAPAEQAKSYTPAQLAALAKLPDELVEHLSMFGMIELRDGRYGFHDLSAARQIAGLLGAGVPLSVIGKSLQDIRKWWPDARLSNLRLSPESEDRIVIQHMNGRTDQSGQFLLDVPRPPDDAAIAFDEAQAAEETNDVATAERLYRRVMNLDPAEPAAPFNLGNLLQANGRRLEAETAFRAAVKADPGFAPAWYNLADILDEQRRTLEAIECLKRALDADPTHADAVFNMALFLQRLDRHAQAAEWWRQYLRLDSGSSWATRAKRALKYCEMQAAGH